MAVRERRDPWEDGTWVRGFAGGMHGAWGSEVGGDSVWHGLLVA